jgi:orotidine-5'-phosphate decarboxylase
MKRDSGREANVDPRDRLIVALDLPGWDDVESLVSRLGEEVLWYKVGLQLFTVEGPEAVRRLVSKGKKVFLDLKVHDIPNTVEMAAESAAGLGAGLLTLHTVAGEEALARAASRVREREASLRLLGVTVLTSSGEFSEEDLGAEVLRRAEIAAAAGLDAIVAPAATLGILRRRFGTGLSVLCPGIRPRGVATQDQRWVVTPGDAVGGGARWIVVGRPITKASDPATAAAGIRREIAEALERHD